MEVMLSRIKWNFTIVYIDNIMMFSKSPQQHIGYDREVFSHLQSASAH